MIALHGHLIKRSVLNAVFDYCRKMKFEVSVLLVDGDSAPSPALADFLGQLKQAGLSGRLFRQAGSLGQAVLKFARRHKDISLILVDSMKNWGAGVPLNALSPPVGLFSGVVAT
ncbi:hypothetical protein [Thiobacillus denitrificans]|uniref:hypothetical protein n=1 Tax=Thiobacillus denitrificans TaxID=36861 RepID=UPI0012FC6E2B|nr:hypothetical protein [Thiobacillus denitrificans]